MKRIALIQMGVVAGNKERNVEHAFELLEEAAKHADILVLPELWMIGYNLRQLNELACIENDDLYCRLEDFAKTQSKWLVAGSVAVLDNEHIYNRTYCFGPSGRIADYSKLHLFSLLSEPKLFAPGKDLTILNMAGIDCGLSICYDLRFPELYRSLSLGGATLIFVPAEWPDSRLLPWNVLNQARAIENQVYICAVNAVGEYRGNRFAGRSALIAPDGSYVVQGGNQEGIFYGVYDSQLVESVRAGMSVWADRRPDVYSLDQ